MSVEYICDGCGKRAPAQNGIFKPDEWYERLTENDVRQHVCSYECIKIVEQKTGITSPVMPGI